MVEVGAGQGALTQALAARAGRVIAVELDEELCQRLHRRFAERPNVFVACTDVLAVTPADLLSLAGATPPYIVVGNLPYNIGTPVVRHFLEDSTPPRRLVAMLQKEVAESMAARPGDMSLLTVRVQLYGIPRVAFRVPPRAFNPPPKVTSAVVVIERRERLAVDVEDVDEFLAVVQAGFSAPRKQVHNALAHALNLGPADITAMLAEAGIEPTARAQTLSLEQWAALYRAYRHRKR